MPSTHRHAMTASMHMAGLTRAVAQVAGLLVGSFGAPVVAARLCTAVQWLSMLRLVRLPRAFSIVKASLLPHSPCSHACGPASGRGRWMWMCSTIHPQNCEQTAPIPAKTLQVACVSPTQTLRWGMSLAVPGMNA